MTEDFRGAAITIAPVGVSFVSSSRCPEIAMGHGSARRTGASRWKFLCCQFGLMRVMSPSIGLLALHAVLSPTIACAALFRDRFNRDEEYQRARVRVFRGWSCCAFPMRCGGRRVCWNNDFQKKRSELFVVPQVGWVMMWVSSSRLGSRSRRGYAEEPLALRLRPVDRESWPFGLPETCTF
jgi:hypothetical protein